MNKSNSVKQNASLVIPIYNNEKTLVSQLKQAEKILKKICSRYEIIICDDKSTDSSQLLLKKHFSNKPNIKLIFHSKNHGIAKTIYSLYKKAQYSYIVLFSVDGDWNPKDIGKLLKCAFLTGADITIGKRKIEEYSFYRKILSFFYNYLPVVFFQVNTIDAGSIKVIKRELIQNTPIISKSVFFEAELIIRASKNDKKIRSLPIYFKMPINKKSSGGKISLVISSLRDII